MADYKITCCSSVDLTAERIKSLDVTVGKNNYYIDGEKFYDDLYVSETPEQFYAKLESGALPVTEPMSVDELCALFEPILSDGCDLLHIELSSGLSTSWKSSLEALELMRAKYPERKIYIVDSLAASSGYGMLVELAADYKRRGMCIDELRHWLEDNKLRVRHWFCSQNLMHLKRGGRIPAATAVVGTIFKICPVLDVNDMGKLILRYRPIGKKAALKTLVAKMQEQAFEEHNYDDKCFICHSMMQKDAETLKKMVESAFPRIRGKVEIFPIGSTIGTHSGAGTIALFFLSGANRTR